MEKEMVLPDDISVVNVLSACTHSGLVEEGKHYFYCMKEHYGIEPKMEHYGCIVDFLGRYGLRKDAKKIIDEMPMSLDAGVLGALLGACKIHKDIELRERIGKLGIELEPQNSGRYVLLANLYANVGKWDDVANFIAGRGAHPQAKEIYAKVGEMLECIRSIGYVPDTDGVSHDVEEEEKESRLHYHSEKFAIAFGLLKTNPCSIIRVSKNLRVCKDCHLVSKLISKIISVDNGCESWPCVATPALRFEGVGRIMKSINKG
ncbi:hypothetical protein GIB67_029795 [Kingdonia uniflora]|uniref:DYW domain-containing protein n=1 Tax=Kingdonia uniflora TaxID=39325 RepID=A0A7J7NJ07_9MAGN|nr:hypothetical protein GIB67_029795 [Kingdonia uniflora]